ncbi:threonine--tRNA ligase, putative [Plasmodium ovale]|uniref:threonine--tRNA ligase n=1 Tax=Plasmodium ovale TaxID=36330 RepID=A0A1C3KSP6_PLAOA|nr:threonine--tRNA ligase, putative [Plasmodium ovale]
MRRIIMPLWLFVANVFININNKLLITSVTKNKFRTCITRNFCSFQNSSYLLYVNKPTLLCNHRKGKHRRKHTRYFTDKMNSSSVNATFNMHASENFQGELEILKKSLVIGENPDFVKERLEKYNDLKEKKKQNAELWVSGESGKKKINIELLDGSIKEGECHVTTPFQIALSISKKLAEEAIVAKVTYVEPVEQELCDIENEEEQHQGQQQEEGAPPSGNGQGRKGKSSILWDMGVPLLGSCQIEFLSMENEEAKKVFWHSSAHILGSSLEKLFGGYLTIGPSLKEGFYYDIFLGNFSITNDHYKKIEEEFNRLVKENVNFEKLICTKEEVMELFKYNPFKLELIKSKIPNNKKTSVYKCGSFIDLCLGPHIKNTGKVKAFKILKNSSAYWLGNKNNDSLQRIYGISFQKKNELNDYLKFLEEAKKRDHRNVGKQLQFFFFEKETSPGSCFWLPHGTKIYNKLIHFVRKEYRLRKYEEVITPNVFSCDLWKTSGHYQNYKDCMFLFNLENKEWGMKPMNCPGHCIMFKQLNVSYRSLPIRLADFGVLHRNEITGSLSGLTRVRRFQQDDSHIFCSYEHIKSEVLNTLNFIFFIYDLFDFKYELYLSTRPQKYIGNIATWDFAENALKDALNSANIKWNLNEGDGAFYGPKIDILLRDSINRMHQCGTIQLDFQLPIRFNLQYKSKDFVAADAGEQNGEERTEERAEKRHTDEHNEHNAQHAQYAQNCTEETPSEVTQCGGTVTEQNESLKKGFERPIIIHRAILGSVERFVAILIEHTAGKLPFWISPRQAIVLPVSDRFNGYANYVYDTLSNNLFDVEVDLSMNTLNKKIREAQLKQFNFILVVGEKEVSTNTVTVRDRDDPNNQQVYSIQEIVSKFKGMLNVNSAKFNQITPFQSGGV